MTIAFLTLILAAATPVITSVDGAGTQASATARIIDPRQARFDACMDRALDDPAAGIAEANRWGKEGGRHFALQCLGFAYSEQDQWAEAITAFTSAARESERAGDGRAAQLWAQAGNAALAADDAKGALGFFDAALAAGTLGGLNKGEVHLDRARALVALNRLAEARMEFDDVRKLAPRDPLGWLLSATLARRMGQLELAKGDIAEAARLAASDPAVSLELGNIAAAEGDFDRAREQWRNCITLDKDSAAAGTAMRLISELDAAEALPAMPSAPAVTPAPAG